MHTQYSILFYYMLNGSSIYYASINAIQWIVFAISTKTMISLRIEFSDGCESNHGGGSLCEKFAWQENEII